MRRYGSTLSSNRKKILTMNNKMENHKSFLASLKEMSTTTNAESLEPQEELRLEMSRISESGYCAGSAIGIEFFLWQAINGGSREFGAKTITEQEITHLKTLSEQSGGWWCWSSESAKALFIPMDEWQKIYESFCER